ncbi:MAG: hypothetical protein JWM36_3183 [Hyphomicrobiales bacterium]|nr:hypothetical protein [Hyphomicrobiales bacterium]
MRSSTSIQAESGDRQHPTMRRILIDLRGLSGMDQALVHAMVSTLPDHTDIGDQRAIIVALAGRFDPKSIDHLIDHVTEQARIQRARLADSSRFGDLLATAAIFLIGIPVIGLATLLPTDAMAADALATASSGTWSSTSVWVALLVGAYIGGAFMAWLTASGRPVTTYEDHPDFTRGAK